MNIAILFLARKQFLVFSSSYLFFMIFPNIVDVLEMKWMNFDVKMDDVQGLKSKTVEMTWQYIPT